jgi:holo-[acyl-carrier protein] synthase
MICGLGIDVVEVDRFKNELIKSDSAFCRKVFTEEEIEYCEKGSSISVKAQRFAARFTAKESFFKAIGTGLRDGLKWKDVEILRDEQGKPGLMLRNRALELVDKAGIKKFHLSITHSSDYAAAVVILEK